MKQLFKKLALPLITAGMIIGMAGQAFAIIPNIFNDGMGRSWGNPFDGLLNQNKATQIGNLPVDAIVASWDDVLEASGAAEPLLMGDPATAIPLYLQFLNNFGFLNNACGGIGPCFARISGPNQYIGAGNFQGTLSTWGLAIPPSTDGQILNIGDDTPFLDVGIMWYQEVSTPSVLGLLGSTLGFMGYVAYRRRDSAERA